MVATLVRLKLRMLRHTLRKEPWRAVVLVCGAVWSLSMVPSVVGGMVWVSAQSVDDARVILVVAGTLVVVGWTVIPLLVPAMDDALDMSRFAMFGLRAARLTPGLLVASLLSVPALFTAGLCLAPVIVWARHGAAATAVALVAAPLALLMCVLGARLGTEMSARMLGSRRARQTSVALAVLTAAVAVPVVVRLGSLGLEGALEKVPGVTQVLGWTPLGLWAAPAVAASGDLAGGVVRLLIALAWVGIAMVAWTALVHRAAVSPPSRAGQVRRTVDAVLPRSTGRRPGLVAAAAIARRGLRSWTTDPRYMASLLGAVVAPVLVVLLVATVVHAPGAVALSMGIAMAGSLGWGRHNDVAYDGTAFWMHVAAHVPGWADRAGRTVATAAWGLPLTVGVSLTGAAVANRWDLAAAAVGAGVGVLCGGLAVSAVVSALLPYRVPDAGANPYASPLGSVGASLVAQLVSSVATFTVCAPVLALYAASLWWRSAAAPATLAVGVVGGAVTLAAGVLVGGRVYDLRAPRLLARVG